MEKNGFAEMSKNLARYRSENNFVGFKTMGDVPLVTGMLKLFAALSSTLLHNILMVQQNYFLYLAKFLNTSAKSFFPCISSKRYFNISLP